MPRNQRPEANACHLSKVASGFPSLLNRVREPLTAAVSSCGQNLMIQATK